MVSSSHSPAVTKSATWCAEAPEARSEAGHDRSDYDIGLGGMSRHFFNITI